MATFIPAAQVLRVRQLFLLDSGASCGASFYLSYTGSAPSPADLTAVAGTMTAAADSNLFPLLHEARQLAGTIVTDLTSETASEGSVTDDTAGFLTADPVPVDAAVVISYKTGRRHRGGQPKSFLPLGDVNSLDLDYAWQPAFVTDVTEAWTGCINETAAASWSGGGPNLLVALSRYDGNMIVERGTPLRAHNVPIGRDTALIIPVLTYGAQGYIGSQRRRRGMHV